VSFSRLVATSTGFALVEFVQAPRLGERQVTVTGFEESGWENRSKMWTSKYGHNAPEETLDEFLVWLLRISEDEARGLAQDILGPWLEEWRERGGEEEARSTNHMVKVLAALLAIVALLALVGLAALVWLLVRALF
jgi:hypothetical protein